MAGTFGQQVSGQYTNRNQRRQEKDFARTEEYYNSPSYAIDQRNSQIQGQKDAVQSNIDAINQKIEAVRLQMLRNDAWYERKTDDNKRSARANYQSLKKGYEREIQQYQRQIGYAQGEMSKIDEGASASDIISYAGDRSRAEARKQEASSKRKTAFIKQVKTGTLDKDLTTLGLNKGTVNYSQFAGAVEKYNIGVSEQQRLRAYSQKVGYENLSQNAKERLNPSAQEFQKKYPTEVLQFDSSGNAITIQSKVLGKTVLVSDYNKEIDKISNIDASLRLGERVEVPKKPSEVSTSRGEFTEEQKYLTGLYEKKGLLERGFNWVKGKFVTEDFAPYRLQTENTSTAPQGTGGKGTAIEVKSFTPSSQAHIDEVMAFNEKADQLSEDTYKKYEENLANAEGLTQEKVDAFKSDAQKTFNEKIDIYGKELSEKYGNKVKEIERGETIKNLSQFGLGGITKFVYRQSDKDTARRELLSNDQVKYTTETGSFLPTSDAGTLTYKQDMFIEKAKKLSPTEEESNKEYLRDFTKYRERGTPVFIAREIASTKQFGKSTYYGIKEGVYYNPRTFALKVGAVAGATAGVTIASSYTGGFGGYATLPILKYAGVGLVGLYGGSVIVRTSAQSGTYARGRKLGDIISKEILPMAIGGFAGSYIGSKAIGKIDYLYYKYIKKYKYRTSYKFARMETLTGKQSYATITPSDSPAQLRAFLKANRKFLTPDEIKYLKAGGKLRIMSHATPNRPAFKGEKTVISSEGREINAMSGSNTEFSPAFFRVNKSPSYSFYSGQAVPTAPSPLGLRIDTQGFAKIPKGYKPTLKLSELESVLRTKVNPKYYRQTAFMVERGNFGTGYVAGLKPEIEAYLKAGGLLQRIPKPNYYTQIANEKFYQKLEGFKRLGNQEYAFRVKKFSILKPSTYFDKIMGRGAGTFKPMTKGRVVPIERFKALNSGETSLLKQIKLMLKSKPRAEVVNVLQQKQTALASDSFSSSALSSGGTPFTISATYPSSYATLLYSRLIGRSSRKSSPSSSSKSYSSGSSGSSASSLRSAISSLISYPKSRSKSSASSFSYSPSSYSPSSYSALSSYSYTPSRPSRPFYYKSSKSKVKSQLRKFRTTPEIEALLPDFTSRIIGIAPKQVGSVKEALREISRIQTGFGVRTGIRIKGYTPTAEKSLLKGIMK